VLSAGALGMRLLNGKLVQQCLLIAILGFIFYDGLWGGAPRADHIAYLHNMWGDDTLHKVVSSAWDWNRERSNGDYILFRPLLYLQLGLFYHFFGYEFWLWQLASLLLHVAAVLILHSCFWQTRLRDTFWPFVLALPLAVSQFGAEMVLWTHVSGYLLFVVTALGAFRFLIGYAQGGHLRHGIASLLCAFAGTFLYETGTLLCLLIAFFLFARAWARRATFQGDVKRRDIALGVAFLVAGFICPAWGITDYLHRYTSLPFDRSAAGGASVAALLFQASWYAVLQIGHWLMGFLLPTQFLFSTVSRMVGRSVPWWPVSPLQAVVDVAALLVVLGAGMMIGARVFRQSREFYFSVILCALFLYGYSWVIAAGRGISRGLDYVFFNNIYYAHIAYAAIGAVICTGLLLWRDEPRAAKPSLRGLRFASMRAASPGPVAFVLGMLTVAAVNAESVATASSRYRYQYAPDLLEIVAAVRDWHGRAAGKPDAYFVVGQSCRGNEVLDWFDTSVVQRGKGWAPPATFADALFPEHSFALNKNRPAVASIVPETIECVADHLSESDLLGDWRGRRGARYSFAITGDGQLTVTDKSGAQAAAAVVDGRVDIPAWSLSGRITRTGASLLWNDGTAWRR
jgi:hypothetical protein